MLNFSCNCSFAFFNSSLNFLCWGKSTSTSTRLLVAYASNSAESRTFLFNSLQGGHQSDPVKSINTSFFSALACAWAFSRSVSQTRLEECSAPSLVQPAAIQP